MTWSYPLVRDVLVAVAALAALLVAYAIASAPSREASRLGLRGLKREAALAGTGGFVVVEPLLRWLGVRMSGLLSERTRASIDAQLRIAGDYLGLTAEEYMGAIALGAAAGGSSGFALGLAIGSAQLLLLFGAPLGAAVPYLLVSGEGQRRMLRIRHELPHAIDLMTLSMSAGLDFPAAVRQVIEKAADPNAPVVEEFRLVLGALQLGRTRKQALLDFADRAPIDSVLEFTSSVVQAEERGNPIAQVLAVQAEALRRRRTTRAEEAASRAGVAMAGPLFLLFAAIMIIIVAPMILKLQRGM
jgi:tight adherence protein C